MKRSLFALLLIVLSSCALPGAPGHITEAVSSFDNTRTLSMEAVGMDGSLGTSLYWSSALPPGKIILEMQIAGLHRFPKESLALKLDGRLVQLKNLDESPEYETVAPVVTTVAVLPGGNLSRMRYLVDVALVKEIVEAKQVLVKLNYDDHYFAEGDMSADAPYFPKPVFRAFLQRL